MVPWIPGLKEIVNIGCAPLKGYALQVVPVQALLGVAGVPQRSGDPVQNHPQWAWHPEKAAPGKGKHAFVATVVDLTDPDDGSRAQGVEASVDVPQDEISAPPQTLRTFHDRHRH